ncbi:MAG: N-acetylmuramoyl-L-alanine amidase [Bacteroidetes bacterium]|nr:MAG: N-acetylmuramoyl-L-alanine amidase [Bacteroidota bacterium]
MLERIQTFFARLFGFDNRKEEIGFEDAADLPPDLSILEVTPDETHTRSVGTRSVARSVGGDGFEDLEGHSGAIDLETVTIIAPKFLWCLDNGHGRLQAGKRSPVWADGTQLEEWKFNREIVQRIIKRLDKLGIQYFNVVPEDDVDSFLAERVARANGKDSPLGLPKLYLSIHANASVPEAKGVETWYYASSDTSKRLASAFQRHLMQALGQETYHWKDRGIRTFVPAEKNFYVLRKTSMPAVLTENGFYTNEEECRQLLDPRVQDLIADAHVAAMVEIEMHGHEDIEIYPLNLQLSRS